MKTLTATALLLLLAAGLCLAYDFEPVSIKQADYKLLSERGRYVTWTWKVTLSNDVGEPHKVKLTVQLLDFSGYEVAADAKTVKLEMWETKTLTGKRRLERDLWEKVVKADYRLELRK